jgi:hypothetical protein
MQPAWVRSLRAQCRRAGIPFFFKQWGGQQKSVAGRELDGRTYDEMPTVVRAARPGALQLDLTIQGLKLDSARFKQP